MNININIKDKRAAVEGQPTIVCGNSDYTITFTFDEEWSEYEEKVARFLYVQKGEVEYKDVPFTGVSVPVPVLSNVSEVSIGVYVESRMSSTAVRIPCERSIRCRTGEPHESEATL